MVISRDSCSLLCSRVLLCQPGTIERTTPSQKGDALMDSVRIFLMRHVEKPDDPLDPDLSGTGRRGGELVTYIPTFHTPDLLSRRLSQNTTVVSMRQPHRCRRPQV